MEPPLGGKVGGMSRGGSSEEARRVIPTVHFSTGLVTQAPTVSRQKERERRRGREGGREEGGDEQSTVERRKEEKQRIHFLCVYVRIQSHHCCLFPHEPFHHLHPHRVCRIWGKRLGKHYANHRLEATGAATAQSPTPDLSPRRNLEIKD